MADVEDAVGIPDVAISFASDGDAHATLVVQFLEFHSVSVYDYRQNKIRHLGQDIFEVMGFAFSHARGCVILNTPLYGRSAATKFERKVISQRTKPYSLAIFELSGNEICNDDFHNARILRFDEICDVCLIEAAEFLGALRG